MTISQTQSPKLGPLATLLVGDKGGQRLLMAIIAVAIIFPFCNLVFSPDSIFHVSTYTLTLTGKYLCYALLALSVDLIWGYCGILSLGHGAFFALGGYAMGM
ncbi:MAG: urea ABC transporter permease subunit UrtC, partial [Bermanella sp.]